MNWFKLNSKGNPYFSSNYTLNNNPGCIGNETICAIFASGDVNGKPIITGNIRDAIALALSGIATEGVTQLKNA